MAVQLELVGGVVTFSPPLTPHSSLPSIPEIVAKWMDSYVATTRYLPRVLPNRQVSGSCMYPLTCVYELSKDHWFVGPIMTPFHVYITTY